MQLKIERDQKLDRPNTVTYKLCLTLLTSPEEQQALDRYRQRTRILTEEQRTSEQRTTRVSDLLQGATWESENLPKLVQIEQQVIRACQELAEYLRVHSAYRGVETVEL